MHQPALRLQPEVAALLQISDGMRAEKIRCDLLFRRFAGHRFRAAFAKFENFPILIRAWPGAALANEPVLLINLEPCSNPADETGLAHRDL